jgi:alkylhydroperoxidase family enzyme
MADDSTERTTRVISDAEIAARQELILGHPQRMRPLERNEETVALAMDYWRKLRRSITGKDEEPGPADKIPAIHFTMLRHPGLWEQITALSVQLSGRGQLSVRERELVILRTGWLCQAPFEWGEHVKFGKSMGITGEEVERVTVGSSAPDWDEHERALMRAVEELHTEQMISDDTWEMLSRRLSDTQLFELTVLVGQFTTVAYWQNSLRIPLGEGNVGLAAR